MREHAVSFDLRVESRFKNALLFRALDEFLGPGWKNAQAAKYLGVQPVTFSLILRLKRPPRVRRSRRWKTGETVWSVAAQKIADKLGYNPVELFPDSLYALGLPDVVAREYASPEILSLQEASRMGLLGSTSIDVSTDQMDVEKAVAEALHTLSPREADVIAMRFGIGDGEERSLPEVAKHFGIGKERVRRIEARGLRKLRHPSRSGELKQVLEASR
jgi:RNA polymerase sigma factor (sigma-70 family)